jgi:hypothetical protein
MRVLMWRMRRAARRERGFVDFHVIVGVGGPVENGARRIGSILMNGEGVEGFGERLNGGERPICCARGGRGECGGGGEGRKREAERAARSVHGRNGTPDGRVSACGRPILHGVEASICCGAERQGFGGFGIGTAEDDVRFADDARSVHVKAAVVPCSG